MRWLSLIILCGLLSKICLCQSGDTLSPEPNLYIQKGDYFFERYEFNKSIVYYNRAFKKDTGNYKVLLKLAEAYTKINFPIRAEECYRMAFERTDNLENEYLLKYALALLVNKKYDESKHWLEKYNESVENDLRGEKYIEAIEKRNEIYKDSIIKFVENIKELNTKESEINPVTYRNQIIFSSSRIYPIDAIGNRFYDIYSAHYSSAGKLIKINSFNNSINTEFHEGPLVISGDQTKLFFTRNVPEKDNKYKVKLGIYETTIPEGTSDRLNISSITIDDFNYSIGHPAVNYEGNIMYFTSDSPDGIGGLDIFRSELVNGEWSYPINMGEIINTKGDEMFPFLLNDSVLYFSSDGHSGLGGLDLFKINIENESAELVNLGYPINSRFDDFSLYTQDKGLTGYFCSNRPGGEGSDDIYKFTVLNLKVKGSVVEAINKSAIEDAKISLITGKGEEFLISETENGEFEFSIIPGESYTLIIEKENFETKEILFDEDMTYEMRKHMMIELEPIVTTEIKLEAGQKYDFISGNESITEEYKDNLNDLVSGQGETKDTESNITLLAKEMKLYEGDIYSIQLIKDPFAPLSESTDETLLLFEDDTVNISGDSVLVTIPVDDETNFKVQSDLDYIDRNINTSENGFEIDGGPIFERDSSLTPDQEEAVREIEWLLSLTINATPETDTYDLKTITTDEFSITPSTDFTLQVGKRSLEGEYEDKMEVPLTGGIKYNFSSNPEVMNNYRNKLDDLLEGRKDLEINEDQAIEISLLSKELKIEEGEEFSFSLFPDSTIIKEGILSDSIISVLELNDEITEIRVDEKLRINMLYTTEQAVNINTDIDYLQENFEPDIYNIDLDTIPFFSEIIVDTTGYHKRFLKSIEDEFITESESELNIKYRVQVAAARRPMPALALKKRYKGGREVRLFQEEGWYKYYIIEAPTYFEAKQILDNCGVKDAFIAAYKNGTKLTLKEAMTLQYKERMEENGMSITDSVINIVTVNFDLNSYSLRIDDKSYLQNLVINLIENPDYYVIINGHTDIRGDMAYNYALSDQRAEFVKGILVNKGIDVQRIRTFSFGETQVLKACEVPDDCDESVHKINRRVEIILFSPAQ